LLEEEAVRQPLAHGVRAMQSESPSRSKGRQMFSVALSTLRSLLLMAGGAPFQRGLHTAAWLTLAKGAVLLTCQGTMVNPSAVCTHVWALRQGCLNKDLCQSRQAARVSAPQGKAASHSCAHRWAGHRDPEVTAAHWGKGLWGRGVERNQLPPNPEPLCLLTDSRAFSCPFRL